MKQTLQIEEKQITYTLQYKSIKNTYLRIHGDGEILVSAPKTASQKDIEDFLRRKSQWILSALEEIRQKTPLLENNEAFLCGEKLLLPVGTDRSKWQKQKAAELLPVAYDRAWELFRDAGFPKPSLRLRTMKSRWGSCIPAKSVITLNTALIGASADCQMAVAAHELCHMLHPNHSKAFYAELKRRFPAYEHLHQSLKSSQSFLLYL